MLRIWGLVFGAWGLEFRVSGLGFRDAVIVLQRGVFLMAWQDSI